jgi:chromosome partitioning protein
MILWEHAGMQTIVINSQKGGSGKSSLCRMLSVHLARAANSVFLIDLDPQRTLADWHEIRKSEEPRRAELDADSLSHGLGLMRQQDVDFAFIDTPPQASERLDEVFRLADIVLIPIKPSPDDLKSAAVTVGRLKALGVPFLFVITQAVQNTNITAQAIAALSHHGPVAQTIIVNRVTYPATFTDGRTPEELDPRGNAATETAKLWGNIAACLHASMQASERKVANA